MVVLVFELPNGQEARWTVNTDVVDAVLLSEEVITRQFPDSDQNPLTPNQQSLLEGEVPGGPGEPPPLCIHLKNPYCNIQCVL